MQKPLDDHKKREISLLVERLVQESLQKDGKEDQPVFKRDITLKEAVALIERIEKKAETMNRKVVIAIYNTGARPIAVHCMDDSYIASFDVAVNKAYTSVALKMSTKELKPLCQSGASLYGLQDTNQGQIVIFGGGEPLFHEGRLIGGLGVSGSTEEEDTMFAEYGKNQLKEVMNR